MAVSAIKNSEQCGDNDGGRNDVLLLRKGFKDKVTSDLELTWRRMERKAF